jgi:sigma-E factor negative regulatory protein RseB
MFSRTSSGPDRETAAHDPLPLRIATAAVVVGLIASGVAVLWGDLATPGGVLLPQAAMGVPGQAAARKPPASLAARQARRAAVAASPGVRLLAAAAAACRTLSYQGIQVSADQGLDGSVTSVVQVWHHRGGQAVIQSVTGPDVLAQARAGRTVADPDVDADAEAAQHDLGGTISMTPQMVLLLAENYQVSLGGRALVAGRPADEVVLRRSNGVVAARFWLDATTKLPLRRQVFDSESRLVSDDAFLSLTLGGPAAAAAPAAGRMPASRLLDAPGLARMRGDGWPIPVALPGHLTLVQARQTRAAPGTVVALAYSDGLSVISLFMQRGHLPAQLSGWSLVAVRGQRVFAADPDRRSMAWSARGFVFTLIADAPQTTVDQVVVGLPHGGRSGFLGRMGDGLGTLAGWLDPFR